MADSNVVQAIASLTIAGASSFFTGDILTLSQGETAEEVDMTSLDRAPSLGMVFEPSPFVRYTLTGTMKHDVSKSVPLKTKGQINITYRDATGTVHRWATGWLKSYEPSFSGPGQRAEASFELILSGARTVNPT